jgi:hypothetical protein
MYLMKLHLWPCLYCSASNVSNLDGYLLLRIKLRRGMLELQVNSLVKYCYTLWFNYVYFVNKSAYIKKIY